MASKAKINAIAPWYGGNRSLAEHVGKALDGCNWVGIPFAGGMAEIAHIRANQIVANDLHREIISLAAYVRDYPIEVQRWLRGQLFHPDTLAEAQQLLDEERGETTSRVALAYFVVAWMTRSGTAGTDGEKNGKLCLRWSSSGGGSAQRWQSAINSLPFWANEFKRCTFSTLDVFDFLAKCKDAPKHGIYCDPPFPGPGDKYAHRFTEDQHRRLAARLSEFKACRVVMRFYDHPLVRELYAAPQWRWTHLEGRNQANGATPEVLIVNQGGLS